MNKNVLIILAIVVVLGIGGATLFGSQNKTDDAMMKKDSSSNLENGAMMDKKDGVMMKADGYSGELLGGGSSPYLDFKKSDYDKALAEGKIVFLDFYANWCPICRAEAPELKAGFDSLTTDKVVGFRVNYNDSDTDADEKSLASQFGVTYQHTKVILKSGQQALKDGNQWTRDTVVSEINKVVQ